MTDYRRSPDEFLTEVREISARREEHPPSPLNPAMAAQLTAASRDARRAMDHEAIEIIDVSGIGEREEALLLALAAAATRRGLRSSASLENPRPVLADLTHDGRDGHCDVCDTRAHRLHEMHAQYAHMIFRARVCVRCRRFAPGQPLDAAA